MRHFRILIAIFALALFASACTSKSSIEVTAAATATATPAEPTPADEPAEAPAEEPTTVPDPTATPEPAATPEPTAVPTATPEPTAVLVPVVDLSACGDFEGFASPGDIFAVVGMDYQDLDTGGTLPVLNAPASGDPALHQLANDREDIVTTGLACLLETSGLWYEITADGVTGWVDAYNLGYLGRTDDPTAEIVADLGSIPFGSVISVIGDVVTHFASVEPPTVVTRQGEYTFGDLIEGTIDLIGFGDDAVKGWRLHFFLLEDEDSSNVGLMTVERTSICLRDVTDDGLCV